MMNQFIISLDGVYHYIRRITPLYKWLLASKQKDNIFAKNKLIKEKIHLLKVNPFRRLLISTNCCACFLRVFLVGTSSSSSEGNVVCVAVDGNRGKSGPPFVRAAFPSTEVVVIDTVSN